MVKHKIKVAEKVRSDTLLEYKCVSWLLPPKYMTYIHTYMTFYFLEKKSDVAVRVVEADFGCEVDLKTKVSRKIKVDCSH